MQRGQRALRRESIAGESFTEQDLDDSERVVHPKSDETRAHLTKVASKLLLFRSLDARQISGAATCVHHLQQRGPLVPC